MKYKPYDYQTFATNFVLEHPACGLILDMGLGKSVITLTALWFLLLDSFDVGKVLVVAPKRVAENTWPTELKKWEHLDGLTWSLVLGSEKDRRAALQRRAKIYIINRENVTWLVDNYRWDFDTLVIDELSSFKSSKAQRFRALKRVRPRISRVIGLTGTPQPNGLLDLWPQMYLLDMGQRLGRFVGGYRERFFLPDKRNREVIYSYKPKEGAEEKIYELISDICISMRAADNLDMPELVASRVEVQMNAKERKLYEGFERDMVLHLKDGDLDAVNAAALSGKLVQMANGAVYGENRKVHHIHDRKLDALEDIIEAANGKPLLVAYWYKHDLERIRQRFEVRTIDTPKDIADWNEGKAAMGGGAAAPSGVSGMKIMGAAVATAEQMKAYIKAKNPKVAQSVLDMVPLYLSEGAAEGVRGDIAFAQSCLETGNFGFAGSAVTLDQNNFCGMGVTANGLKGNSFSTAQLGIRAQVQHLKAYASTEPLKGECIDPRFKYVARGCAEVVEWLGQQENPQGKGWATGAGYGEKIVTILKSILATDGGTAPTAVPFKVRVTATDLRIRTGPGTDTAMTGKFTGAGVFTITEVKDGPGSAKGWGRLKSGAGWIALDFAQKI